MSLSQEPVQSIDFHFSHLFPFQQIAEDRSGGGGSRGANGHGFYDYKRGKFVMADGRYDDDDDQCFGKTQMTGSEIQSGAGIGGRNALQIVFGLCFGLVSLCND